MFEMNRDGFAFLAMGFTGKKAEDWKLDFIDAFNLMEVELEKQKPQFQIPQTYKEALLALIEKEEALERAIATKAEIGSRREATAMATASVAVKKANDLEIQLDKSKEYCTIKRMAMITHGQSFSFKLLRDASNEMNMPAIDIYDANYGTVKAYHKDVWLEVYGLEF